MKNNHRVRVVEIVLIMLERSSYVSWQGSAIFGKRLERESTTTLIARVGVFQFFSSHRWTQSHRWTSTQNDIQVTVNRINKHVKTGGSFAIIILQRQDLTDQRSLWQKAACLKKRVLYKCFHASRVSYQCSFGPSLSCSPIPSSVPHGIDDRSRFAWYLPPFPSATSEKGVTLQERKYTGSPAVAWWILPWYTGRRLVGFLINVQEVMIAVIEEE